MATWQQGNAGGLLAGIGTNNVNAPQASDANTALSLIRDNNDRERAGENNLGMQLAGAAGSIFNSYKQGEQVQRQKAFQQDYANAYASGDRGAMRGLVAKYPEQFEAVRNGMGFVDEDQRNTVGNLAASARLASQNPEAMGQWLQKNAGDLTRVGVNPSDVAQMYQQNPAAFGQFVDHLGIASLGPEKYFDLQANNAKLQQTGQIAQANLSLGQQRLQQQAAYQQGQLNQGQQQLNLTAQKNQADNANKQLELSLKAGENSAKSQATQQAAVQKMQDYVGAHQSNANNVASMYDTVNQVKSIKPEVFDRVFGFGGTVNSRIPGTESADAWSKIEQMQGQARLMGVIGMKGTGPVSDSEGQAAARAFLAINQNMSPNAARAAIDNWQKVLQRQTAYLQKQQPMVDTYQQKIDTFNAGQTGGSAAAPRAGYTEGGYTFIGGDPSNPNSWRKN
ncbi:phage DNA ejection protein [Serratia marcescens]|uniref:phage DNA ejection protein n=1 Tax=Serratia marcescens TaxID=615 RepID=UPI000F7F9853|nr:phage DNA ejection protein [Serratia marcescens]RTF49642.1 DNA injection protein [Serratia marcescens]